MELKDFLNEDEEFKNLCECDEERNDILNQTFNYINEKTEPSNKLLKNFLDTKNDEIQSILDESQNDDFLKYVGSKVICNSYMESIKNGKLRKLDKCFKKEPDERTEQDLKQMKWTNMACRLACMQTMEKAKEEFDKEADVKNVLVTMGKGSGTGNGESINMMEVQKLQKSSRLNIKKILELTGHFQATFKHKMRTQSKSIESIVGTTIGNELPNLVQSEMALMVDDDFRSLKELEFVQRNLFQYKFKGKSASTEGNIIVCVDESGSMNCDDNILTAKAFACGLYEQAKAENREMNIISFDDVADEPVTIKSPKDLLKWCGKFKNGGTTFDKPLAKAMEILEKNPTFEKADIIFITDGEDHVSPTIKDKLNEMRKTKNIKIITLKLYDHSCGNNDLNEISNAVIDHDFNQLSKLI